MLARTGIYLNWVDRYNTLGLGTDVSVVLGTGSDSLQFFKPDTKEWFTVRVPYPMGFYTRDIDGRIDDPKTGWKGRGLWAIDRDPRHLACRRWQGPNASNGALPGPA